MCHRQTMATVAFIVKVLIGVLARGETMTDPKFRSYFWCYVCDYDWAEDLASVRDAECPTCGRHCAPMYSDDLSLGPPTASTEAWFMNYYRCYQCKHEWTDEWSATCDDECPKCGARDCSPYHSDDLAVGFI